MEGRRCISLQFMGVRAVGADVLAYDSAGVVLEQV